MRRAGRHGRVRALTPGQRRRRRRRLDNPRGMVCLDGGDERQQAIADALSKQVADELGRSKKRRSDARNRVASERFDMMLRIANERTR